MAAFVWYIGPLLIIWEFVFLASYNALGNGWNLSAWLRDKGLSTAREIGDTTAILCEKRGVPGDVLTSFPPPKWTWH